MKLIDKLIRWYRVNIALREIPEGRNMLDIGCHDGYLLSRVSHKFKRCLGIEPQQTKFKTIDNVNYIIGKFPEDVPEDWQFDCITMLAVAEHLPEDIFFNLPELCERLLNKGGLLVVTQPAIMTDHILNILSFFHLIDEDVHLEEHKGLDPQQLLEAFRCNPQFTCKRIKKFQFGLNNLMVFEKK